MNSITPITVPPTMTRSHEIAGVLRDEILRGQFRPGERLPSERDLAARFGASRGAVREALSQIEQLRLIDIQPGGARIKEVNDASIAVLGPLLGLGSAPDAGLVDQFLDTFSALARFTATRAIPRITETQRTDLLAQLDAMADDLGSVESLQPKMRAFLLTLDRIADNLVVRLISNDLQAQFVERMLLLHPRPSLKPESLQALVSGMRLGVENGDGEGVAAALDIHFLSMRALVAQALASA
ncbi:GntR family transcriptional regulator [Gammaproteobacteria bacterium]|nr:FadR family transcriptional regulator [Gammaproteobacteria bacterium]MDA8617526.1 GntR family transcriptional regulator [Gammaproteobacteria bacterium]MDA9783543.1 GntR family transcriptional regulator [Gammaproteobacteria bacterium]MDC1502440.1 GntR family transcriptional regulator [Gammaproteobacteria bacterium]MDC3362532.1 GntR family transcriptional regulator [Gammaproteobacteria bacterium]